MDSMRSLNTSLPSSVSAQPPEQLLQAFKTAALSVTNLYKTAVADQGSARHLGYQEALEDLRAFLDREKLALDDGDGQKIRKWVVSRIDGTGMTTTTTTSDSEDEHIESQREARRTGSSSPAWKGSSDASRQATTTTASTTSSASTSATSTTTAPPPTFTFSAGLQWPTSLTKDTTNIQSAASSESIPWGPRTPHRNNSRNKRSSTRDASNTGSKRKLAFGDYFDVPDGFGGGKRGRFI